ncbi:MAG TPA: hypothetical protein DIS79_05450, partial [Bacteroidetes bacterium]|nr:hypothetical protein [Bacteroidota bacterium]
MENVEQRQADSVKAAVEQQRKLRADSLLKRFPRITYQRLIVENTSVLDSIRRTFAKQASTMRNYRALTTLNRKDIYFVRLG